LFPQNPGIGARRNFSGADSWQFAKGQKTVLLPGIKKRKNKNKSNKKPNQKNKDKFEDFIEKYFPLAKLTGRHQKLVLKQMSTSTYLSVYSTQTEACPVISSTD